MSWLADLFAEFFEIQDEGATQPTRATLNFGQGLEVTDNPGQLRLDIAIPTTSSTKAGLLPLTTGNDKVMVSPAGVPTWAWLGNLNIAVGAAIEGTKITPAFGAQTVATTGPITTTAALTARSLTADPGGGGTAAYAELGTGSTVAVAPAGRVRLRVNAGLPELSADGGAYRQIKAGPTTASFAFVSPAGAGAVFYAAGLYAFAGTANDFNPPITLGTANSARGAFIGFICAASPGGDTAITITGTSITAAGVRTPGDNETVAFVNADSVSTYRQTEKRWIGQPTIAKSAGLDRLCNYGWVSVFTDNDQPFTVVGLRAEWLAGANDAGIDIVLRHHKATGWTYNAAAPPGFPAALVSMATDCGPEGDAVIGEQGSYLRSGLSTAIDVINGEGLLIEITTTAGATFTFGTATIVCAL